LLGGLVAIWIVAALAVGMETFLCDANAQVKVEFAPILEELQRGIRSQR
jgi:hypothetical protein